MTVTFDIEPVRYRRIFDIEASNFVIDAVRYQRNVDIEAQNFNIVISRYRRFIDIDKCSFDICIRYRSFFASISNFVFFDIGVSLSDPVLAAVAPARYWIAVCTLQCKSTIDRKLCAARGPGRLLPPQRRLQSRRRTGGSTGHSRRSGARQPERRPQPPDRASTERRSM
jgi:hypothetical protein